MANISFTRTSERILTWVEPQEGFTLEQVIAALNAGTAELGSTDTGWGTIRESDGRQVIAFFGECQTTAGPEIDANFAEEKN